MMVEATRLLVTLTATAAGFIVGSHIGDSSSVVGATIGAGWYVSKAKDTPTSISPARRRIATST